jgi:hypothetical protein
VSGAGGDLLRAPEGVRGAIGSDSHASAPQVLSWDDLVTTALVGTERRPLPAAAAPDGTPLTGPAAATDEARVLALAAVAAAWRTAGWQPAEAYGPGVDPAPPDTRPECSVRAAQLLDLVLAPGTTFADPRSLLGHWLACAAEAGVRPPHRLLIPLLARATTEVTLRSPVAGVVDRRGRWLAARQPDWGWLVTIDAVPDSSGWATAGRFERVAMATALRATDPGEGRRLVTGELASLSAAERAELVETLGTGLGPDDEPLLEDLLDDRSRAVRVAAAALLDRLPGSRRAARLAGVLGPLVRTSGRVRRRVELELPDEDDPVLARDLPGDAHVSSPVASVVAGQLGLGGATQGRRAVLLRRLVAAAPLATWTDAGVDPSAAVTAAGGRPELVVGLAAAVVAQGDREWADALFDRLPLPALVPLIPPAVAEARLAARAARATDAELSAVLVAAGGIAEPWTPAFSAAVVARARRVEVPHVVVAWRNLLAERLHPSTVAVVEAWIAELVGDDARPLRRQVRQLHQALTMRRAITEELCP